MLNEEQNQKDKNTKNDITLNKSNFLSNCYQIIWHELFYLYKVGSSIPALINPCFLNVQLSQTPQAWPFESA